MRTATVAIVGTVLVGIVVIIGLTVLADTLFERGWKEYEGDD